MPESRERQYSDYDAHQHKDSQDGEESGLHLPFAHAPGTKQPLLAFYHRTGPFFYTRERAIQTFTQRVCDPS